MEWATPHSWRANFCAKKIKHPKTKIKTYF